MPRPIWRGVITFGMVSIPVGLYTATQEKDISFNQIHSVCGSRIRYQKFCPVCDRAVEPEEIERGYEYAKGHYAIVNDEDFEALPVPSKHTIADSFLKLSGGAACVGDSGGPVLDGDVVVAVNSFLASGRCASPDYAQRVDTAAVLGFIAGG